MKYIALSTMLLLVFSSCGRMSSTANEDKAVKEILDFYGGQCKYAIGFTSSTGSGKKRYFELELSQSDVVEKYAGIVEMPASNIAYLFYKNLKEEKSEYNDIHVITVFKDGTKKEFSFPVGDLDLVNQKMGFVQKVVGLIKTRNYDAMRQLLSERFREKHNADTLVMNMTKIDSACGLVKDYIPYGFHFGRFDDGARNLQMSGAVMGEKANHEFSIYFDPASKKEEIDFLKYSF